MDENRDTQDRILPHGWTVQRLVNELVGLVDHNTDVIDGDNADMQGLLEDMECRVSAMAALLSGNTPDPYTPVYPMAGEME